MATLDAHLPWDYIDKHIQAIRSPFLLEPELLLSMAPPGNIFFSLLNWNQGPSNLFQQDDTPVHEMSSIKTWFAKTEMEEIEWPVQNPNLNSSEQLWDELKRWLCARPSYPKSMHDLTNTSNRQIPTTIHQCTTMQG